MSNTLFDYGRELFLTKGIDWTDPAKPIKCLLIDTGSWTPNFATHKWLSDIGSGARISTTVGVEILSRTATAGAADGADIEFTSVTGASIEALVLYVAASGVEGECPLIAYIDTATGLPITPNGGSIIVTWDNGPNKIFKL